MTLIVGMVGSDGIVLAADEKAVDFAGSNDRHFDEATCIEKITIVTGSPSFVYAIAGDRHTKSIGYEIQRRVEARTFEFSNPERSLVDIAVAEAGRIGKELLRGLIRVILIALPAPEMTEWQLWRLEVRIGFDQEFTACQIRTCAVDGARNPARFFATFFQCDLPVDKLRLLAAHLILKGHDVDSMIDGLSMAICDESGIRRLKQFELKDLRRRSQELDELFRKKLYL
jgi:hypothetical protein